MTSLEGRVKKNRGGARCGAAVSYAHRSLAIEAGTATVLALRSERERADRTRLDRLTSLPLELRKRINLPNAETKSLNFW